MKKTFAILLFILVAFLFILHFREDVENSKTDIILCLFTIVISLLLYFKGQQHSEYKGYWAKPGNLLLLSLFIVNYQLIIDLIVGLRSFDSFPTPSVTVRTCYISTLGVLATLVGLCAYNPHQESEDTQTLRYGKIDMTFLVVAQVIVFIIWVATVNIGNLLNGTLYGSGGTDYWETLYNYIIIVQMTCICLNSRDGSVQSLRQFIHKNSLISWLFIGLYMLFRLVSGDRGPFIYTGTLVLFSYIFCTKKRFSRASIIVVLFIGSVALTLIGMARQDAASGTFGERIDRSYSELSFSERFGTTTLFAPTLELANSYKCNQYAVSEIEAYGRPLHHGVYQLFQIAGIVPFLSSYIVNTYAIPESQRTSGYYFTYLEKGDYHQWGQIGTTCIADFFMDFGEIGVLIGMLLLGILFSWIDRVICLKRCVSPFTLLVVLTYASISFYIGRSAVIAQLKPIIGLLFLFYLNLWLFNRNTIH